MQPILTLGFVGGSTESAVGYTHFSASRLDNNFRLEAGCFSRDWEKNLKSANIYRVSPDRTHPDWIALLEKERDQIDAVVILTPTPNHVDVVIAALKLGYPVICEKSLATSTEECLHICAAVAENHGYLAVTYNYSGYPMVRELRRMISEGCLGRLQQIHIEMPQESFQILNVNPQSWRRRDYSVPTVSLDLGIHVHHLVDFLTNGLKPIFLIGEYAKFGKVPGIVDNVYCIACYENDVRVQAWWGKTALGHRNGLRIRVYGESAGAEWYQMEPETLRWTDSDGRSSLLDRGSGELKTAREARYNRFKVGHPSGFIEAFANIYTDIAVEINGRLTERFVKNPYVYGSEQGLLGLSFLEAINSSVKSRSWVPVKTF